MHGLQVADHRVRRFALILIAGAVFLGLFLVLLVEKNGLAIENWFLSKAHNFLEYPELAAFVFFIMVLPIAGISIYFWRFGSSAVASERFPPQGATVLRDTIVRIGKQGIRRGRILQILSAMLFLASISLPVFLWYVFTSLKDVV